MGRWFTAWLALVAGCSFDASGGEGSRDGGSPPLIDASGDARADEPDAGGPCTTGALDFSPDEWVSVSHPSLDLTNNFTVEAWVRPRTVNSEFDLVSRHDSGASEGYVLMIKDRVPEFRVYFADDSGPASHCDCHSSGADLTVDRWVHIAGSFSDGTSYLFEDGVLMEICNCQDTCTGTCEGDVASYAGSMAIGIEAGRLDRFAVDGLIDDVHVLGSATTSSFEPLAAAACDTDTLLQFRFEPPVSQSLSSGCGAAATGRLGSESGADLNDPDAVDTSCPPSR